MGQLFFQKPQALLGRRTRRGLFSGSPFGLRGPDLGRFPRCGLLPARDHVRHDLAMQSGLGHGLAVGGGIVDLLEIDAAAAPELVHLVLEMIPEGRAAIALVRATVAPARATVALARAIVAPMRAVVALVGAIIALIGAIVALMWATVALARAAIALVGAIIALVGAVVALVRATIALIRATIALMGATVALAGAIIALTGATVALIGAIAAPLSGSAAFGMVDAPAGSERGARRFVANGYAGAQAVTRRAGLYWPAARGPTWS
jgi:hypothetical protein